MTDAPPDLHGRVRQLYQLFGDDPDAIADWLRSAADYVEAHQMTAEHQPHISSPTACSNAGHDVDFRSGVRDRCRTCDVDF